MMRRAGHMLGIVWKIVVWAARRLRSMRGRSDVFTPTWEATPLDDLALQRPLNLLHRPLRWIIRLRAWGRAPGLRLRSGVTVVIVNWNSLDLLEDVLLAVRRFSPPSTRILVVDNASSDGSRRYLRRARARGELGALLLPANLYHGPAMDLGILMCATEYVVALDVDAFPVRPGWLDTLLAPLDEGAAVSGAAAMRGYVHPCCLAIRLTRFADMRHTFTPHVGDWNATKLGSQEWDTGESISRREGEEGIALFERTRVRGPLQLGCVFGDFVFHNGASTRLRGDDVVEGLTLSDVRDSWAEAVTEFLDAAGAAGRSGR